MCREQVVFVHEGTRTIQAFPAKDMAYTRLQLQAISDYGEQAVVVDVRSDIHQRGNQTKSTLT